MACADVATVKAKAANAINLIIWSLRCEPVRPRCFQKGVTASRQVVCGAMAGPVVRKEEAPETGGDSGLLRIPLVCDGEGKTHHDSNSTAASCLFDNSLGFIFRFIAPLVPCLLGLLVRRRALIGEPRPGRSSRAFLF